MFSSKSARRKLKRRFPPSILSPPWDRIPATARKCMSSHSPESRLLSALRNRDQALAEKAKQLIRAAKTYLAYAPSSFPGGTDHTQKHTTAVEEIAGMLLPDSLIAELTPQELFYLTLACHYHDLGMVGTVADDSSESGRQRIRAAHSVSIGERLRNDWQRLGFDDQKSAEILGEICRGHRPSRSPDGKAIWDDLDEVEVHGLGVSIRVRLLSALIYAIDELHIGADRAPEEVAHWRQIKDDESRRHWARHKLINGPSRYKDQLLIEVSSEAPGAELSICSKVLQKAFSARQDLIRQLESERIAGRPLSIHVKWIRRPIWANLLPLALSDLVKRTRPEMERAILDLFNDATRTRVDLSATCTEQGNTDAERRSEIARIVDDEIRCGRIVPAAENDGAFLLSTDQQASEVFFERMRLLDESDQLFLGLYRQAWESKLFRSKFGREYVKTTVVPLIVSRYSVNVAQLPPTDSVRVLLELSPSAVSVALVYQPFTSTLVKMQLLKTAIITGVLFDAFNSPDTLLESELRRALRELVRGTTELEGQIRFLEELALVGGFTFEQITSMMTPHDKTEAPKLFEKGDSNKVEVTLSQAIPAQAPIGSIALPYVAFASQRAGEDVTIIAEPGCAIKANSPIFAEVGHEGSIYAIGFGQGKQPMPPLGLKAPARLEGGSGHNTVRVRLTTFTETEASTFPFIFSLPAPAAPALNAETVSVRASAAIRWQLVTINDLGMMVVANRQIELEGLRIEFVFAWSEQLFGTANVAKASGGFFKVPPVWNESLRSLDGLEGNLPLPLFVNQDRLRQIAASTPQERQAFWRGLREKPLAERPLFTALLLQFAGPDEAPVIHEEFLNFHSGFQFPPPALADGGTMSQEDFARKWSDGAEEVTVSAFFRSNVYELAESLRTWAQGAEGEFPLSFDTTDDSEPGFRSKFEIIFGPEADRVWHRLRPVTFRLRPISGSESYKIEAAYWRQIGDARRAELAEEIRSRREPSEPT